MEYLQRRIAQEKIPTSKPDDLPYRNLSSYPLPTLCGGIRNPLNQLRGDLWNINSDQSANRMRMANLCI